MRVKQCNTLIINHLYNQAMKYKSLPVEHTAIDQLRLFSEMKQAKSEGTMIIAKCSTITGIAHFAELAITKEQVDNFSKGAKVQHAFPNLNIDEREFILSGIVPEEWDATFGED